MPISSNYFVVPDDLTEQQKYDIAQIWTGIGGNPSRKLWNYSAGRGVLALAADPSNPSDTAVGAFPVSSPMTDTEYLAAIEAAIPIIYGDDS
ncbi:hypothetical protein ACP6H1_07575 [Vibrio harveyi]|uniref:hypothetical protein n=1 Tax=Vibrio harveyi TaxID=669 RepID=UPI00237F5503|nr:hypothetical protein [Vibrio harveyi]EKO3871039.1 hypothetical protein [Vibrio harveyi]MDF6011873.1 hypothetical protein [Vibrio harveyi]HDM8070314.1 hypothetical protein [Vibrio harveyi]